MASTIRTPKAEMSTRTYGQACSVANFLDQFGARWTLLIVRDLLIGPRRFKQLLTGLPGIGANRLTEKLRWLGDQGVVRKEAPPGEPPRYELTDKGKELESVILGMARWGLRHLSGDSEGKLHRPDLLVVAFRAAFNSVHARGVTETYEFRIDDTTFFVQVDDGELKTDLGPAPRPSFILTTDSETFDQIVAGNVDVRSANERQLVHLIGDWDAYARCARMFDGK